MVALDEIEEEIKEKPMIDADNNNDNSNIFTRSSKDYTIVNIYPVKRKMYYYIDTAFYSKGYQLFINNQFIQTINGLPVVYLFGENKNIVYKENKGFILKPQNGYYCFVILNAYEIPINQNRNVIKSFLILDMYTVICSTFNPIELVLKKDNQFIKVKLVIENNEQKIFGKERKL